jgi:hypothetical protein
VLTCKPIRVLEVAQSSKGKKERANRGFVVTDRFFFKVVCMTIRRLPSRAIRELEKILRGDERARTEDIAIPGWREPAKAVDQDDKLALELKMCATSLLQRNICTWTTRI